MTSPQIVQTFERSFQLEIRNKQKGLNKLHTVHLRHYNFNNMFKKKKLTHSRTTGISRRYLRQPPKNQLIHPNAHSSAIRRYRCTQSTLRHYDTKLQGQGDDEKSITQLHVHSNLLKDNQAMSKYDC